MHVLEHDAVCGGATVWRAGKYSVDAEDEEALPTGPRGQLFRQILPECRGVRAELRDIAASRRVSESQVRRARLRRHHVRGMFRMQVPGAALVIARQADTLVDAIHHTASRAMHLAVRDMRDEARAARLMLLTCQQQITPG